MAQLVLVRARSVLVVLLASATCLLMATPARGQKPPRPSGRRVALAIGNAAYPKQPLLNTENDANAMGAALRQMGFSVDVVLNASYRDTVRAIDGFIETVQEGDVALFFYAGHGIQVEGENYLVPTDFNARDEAEAKYVSYSVSRVHDRIAGKRARLTILILDACRSNPYSSSRSASAGLAQMSAAAGSFIGFATGPGKTASDNPRGRNGTYTAALLEALGKPGLNLEQVFYEARQLTFGASEGKQVPWSNSSVIGDFYFRPPAAATSTAGVAPSAAPPAAPPSAPAVNGRGRGGSAPRPNASEAISGGFSPEAQEYRQSCDGGIADGCWKLGLMYDSGRGVPLDYARARLLFERACDDGSVTGCESLGRFYFWNTYDVPQDRARTRALYQRACEAGRATACVKLGDTYYAGTVPAERDDAQARLWFERACRTSDRQCWRLAISYEGERDQAISAFFERGGGDMKASARLQAQAASQAVIFYERSCVAGYRYACLKLGGLYEPGGGNDGVDADLAKALVMYQRGCAIEQAKKPEDPLEPYPDLAYGRATDAADGGANCGAIKRLGSR